MVTAIVLGVLGVGMVAAFGLTLRVARRTPGGVARRGRPSAPASGLDRLEVGAELAYDDQRWDVVGVQRVRPADGAGWSAWHLDDRGQSGWMATTADADEVVFAVRAERPEALDPAVPALTWRDHEWVRTEAGASPATADGERRLPRGARVPLPRDAAVERVVFVREDLPRRRLVLERAVGEERPHAWIGGTVPARMIDVWPQGRRPSGGPTGRTGAPDPTGEAAPRPAAPSPRPPDGTPPVQPS